MGMRWRRWRFAPSKWEASLTLTRGERLADGLHDTVDALARFAGVALDVVDQERKCHRSEPAARQRVTRQPDRGRQGAGLGAHAAFGEIGRASCRERSVS